MFLLQLKDVESPVLSLDKEFVFSIEFLMRSTRISSRKRPKDSFHWIVGISLSCMFKDFCMVVLRAMEMYASSGGVVFSWMSGGHSALLANPTSAKDVSLSLS